MINIPILVEDLAKALYSSHDTGENPKRPWSADSYLQPQLDEYEREDYRLLARTAISFLEQRFKS